MSITYRHTGLRYSGAFHIALLAIAVIGLPKWFKRYEDPEPQVMTVEVLPFAAVSNVKPQQEAPKPAPAEKVQPAETKKAVQEAHKDEAKPKPEEMVPLPKPVQAKPIEKPVEKPTEKKLDNDFDRIIKSVKDTAKTQEAKKPQEVKSAAATPAKSERYDPTAPLSISEKDAIRSQFIRCWNVPAGAKDAQNLAVVLRVGLNEDGSVATVVLAHDEDRYSSDSFFRAATDSAIRAVHLCSPLKNLPPDKFGAWRDMELTFDPKEMLN